MKNCVIFALTFISVHSIFARKSDCESDSNDNSATAISDPNQRWPRGNVPYFIDSAFRPNEVSDIKAAIAYFNTKFHPDCIRFRPKNDYDGDYVNIIKKARSQCQAEIGRKGGAQEIILGENCLTRDKIMHEMLHVIGMIHEHNRPDRDEYLTIHCDNIKDKYKKNFKRVDESGEVFDLDYDGKSIMHYEAYNEDWAIDPEKQIMTKKGQNRTPTYKLGTSKDLTDLDRRKAEKMYSCPPGKPSTDITADICNKRCDSDSDCSNSKHCKRCCWWAFGDGNVCTRPVGGVGCIPPLGGGGRSFPSSETKQKPIEVSGKEVCNSSCEEHEDCSASDSGCTFCCWWITWGKICSTKALGFGCI